MLTQRAPGPGATACLLSITIGQTVAVVAMGGKIMTKTACSLNMDIRGEWMMR